MSEGRRIRILHVAQAAGGVSRYLQMLIKYLNNDKFENILVCSFDYSKDIFENNGAVVEQIEMHREIGLYDLSAALTVRSLIKKYQPDIIYAHSSKAGALARMANLGLSSKCIYNPHGWAFNMRGSKTKQWIYATLEKIMAHFCDEIICISEAEKNSALKHKICGERKISIIVNGIDVDGYEKQLRQALSRRDLDIPKDAFVVGMVGRLSPQKAPDVFIRAAEIIKKSIPNAYFVMVGDGEQRNEVWEFASTHGLGDSLFITGWVDDPMCYVQLFDVALLLSRWEGFGLVLPEYMLAGKPIVATRVDAIPEIIIDGTNGLLVEENDYQTVAELVRRIYDDVLLAAKLKKNGYAAVQERFDVRRVAAEHERLFRG